MSETYLVLVMQVVGPADDSAGCSAAPDDRPKIKRKPTPYDAATGSPRVSAPINSA